MTKKSKLLILTLSLMSLIFTGCSSSVEDVISYLEEDNYSKAIKAYNNLSENDKELIKTEFENKVEDITQKYMNEKIDASTTKEALNKIKSISSFESIANDAISTINTVDSSRTHFNSAEVAFSNKDYEKALKNYSSVVSQDTKNYEKAQQKIKEIYKELEDSILVEVSSAKLLVQHSEWKALYPDMLNAIVVNNSDKTIKNITIGFLAWDSNNYPVKISCQLGQENFLVEGSGEGVNIIPGATWGENQGWELSTLSYDHNISTIKANVKEVEFYDGTSWSNPLYDSWLNQYKEKPLP